MSKTRGSDSSAENPAAYAGSGVTYINKLPPGEGASDAQALLCRFKIRPESQSLSVLRNRRIEFPHVAKQIAEHLMRQEHTRVER
jgi:hypothetical protein